METTNSVCTALISENFYMADHSKVLYINQSQYIGNTLKPASLDELGHFMSESLHIDEANLSPNTVLCQTFDNSGNLGLHNDADCKDLVEIETTKVNAQMELSKSVTFPCFGKTPLPTISTDGKSEGVNDTPSTMKQSNSESSKTAYPRSISLPSPLKLVSAMKGTREKLGKPRDKASVTWAPDVYDPPPSAASTAVITNKPRRKGDRRKNIDSKKNGKSKQKKKSSKGSSSKDKRPVQKYYRGTNAFYQSFEGGTKLVVDGFDCGSTFLKTTVTNLHFSLAEAT